MTDPTGELLRRAATHDAVAVSALMNMHRGKLRRLVAVRLDRRIVARVDPSDVVQETDHRDEKSPADGVPNSTIDRS